MKLDRNKLSRVVNGHDCQGFAFFLNRTSLTEELLNLGYSYIPVYGEYEGILAREKALIIFPYNNLLHQYCDYEEFEEAVNVLSNSNPQICCYKEGDLFANLNEWIQSLRESKLTSIYLNKYPKSIAEHRTRAMSGELVRFEFYP